MFNFSSTINKNKKLFAFILIFLIFSGIAIPQQTKAEVSSWWLLCPPCYIGLSIYDSGMTQFAKDVTNGLIIGTSSIAVALSGALAGIGSKLYELGTAESNFFSYTGPDNPVVTLGWARVRDLANMVVVLGFVIIGLATALRLKEYEAQKLLPKLIIAALLINFSLLACGIFIDGANIVQKGLGATSGGYAKQGMVNIITAQMDSLANEYKSGVDPTTTLATVGGIIFYNIVEFIIFILFGFLFIFRHMALWILVLLSPLAFVSYVFPFTKRFWDMWWTNFFGWCIIGIPASFTLYLADNLMQGLQTNPTGFIVFFIPGTFLIIGFLFTLQVSAMGAGAAVKAFNASGRGARNAGGALKELSSRTRTGQATQEALASTKDRLLSATGFASSAYPAQQKSARASVARKEVDALRTSSSAGDRNRFDQLVRRGVGPKGAEAVASASEHGELQRILNPDNNLAGLQTMNQRISSTSLQFGHERGEFDDKNYQLARFNPNKVNNALRAAGLDPANVPAGDPARIAAEDRAVEAQFKTALPKMSGNELRNIHENQALDYETVRDNFKPHMVDQIQTSPNEALRDNLLAHEARLEAEAVTAHTDGNQKLYNDLTKLREAILRLP